MRVLLDQSASVSIEWAAPGGERNSVDLSMCQLQAGCGLINETTESADRFRVKGSLILLNPARRIFRMESEDGRLYKGKLSDALRLQYSFKEVNVPALPVRAEGLIERQTVVKPRLDVKTVTDTLVEIDMHPGLDVGETLYSLKELYGGLAVSAGRETEYMAHPGISMEDYSGLAELLDQLMDSSPLKGA
ncbi:hypothetical protein K0U00_45490, partial [Paenibacillus sepulcri]|nr:hypothetical protein [Paenibacillus sepulcri]